MGLRQYKQKRDFHKTAEPEGEVAHSAAGNRYLIQKHAASHLHYDLRLEMDGVLKSWAVPKGPSVNPADKRLAVQTEDHPLAYGDFEGTIPKGEYGGGTVMLWDTGTWEPEGDPKTAMEKGQLSFTLHGERLKGGWHLARMPRRKGEKRDNWLLIKQKDEFADKKGEKPVETYADSVVTHRLMEEIAKAPAFNFVPAAKAKKARQPDFIPPQLATLENDPPEGENWLHEIKYDGYRLQLRKDGDKVNCLTRRGHDWSQRFLHLCEAVRGLPCEQATIDGEAVVLDSHGISDFKALQNSLTAGRENPIHYYAFDLLYCDGHDLQKTPLETRKAILKTLLAQSSELYYSDHIRGEGKQVYASSCTMALEGIISKKAGAPYSSGRGRSWLKSKCSRRQEFVIAGFLEPKNKSRGIGALLLGVYDKGKLVYAGKVGTGFSDKSGTELRRKLDRLIRKTPAYSQSPQEAGAVWVKPELVGEVEFTEWTNAGALRHPSFIALREDKAAKDIVREPSEHVPEKPMPEIRLTSPDKVLYPAQGLTKQDLTEYYHRVAERMLPFIVDRPLSLVRCPEGREKSCFFQRHHGKSMPKAIDQLPIKSGEPPYLMIRDEEGLLSLVQIGALEIHPWGARADNPDKPDLLILDMDPGEGASWQLVKDAAAEARERLARLGLESFLKVTGGKGLHVVAPLERRQDWATLKAFTKAIAVAMEHDHPDRYISTMSKAKRKGKVFVDYLRNDKSATGIAPYSTRAREGAPVAMPLGWEELDSLTGPDVYRVGNAERRLAHLNADPWAGWREVRQSITKGMVGKI